MSMDKTFVRKRAEDALRLLDEEDQQFVEAYIKDRARPKEIGVSLLGWLVVAVACALSVFVALKTPGCVEMHSGLRALQVENAKLRAACVEQVLSASPPPVVEE